MPRVLPLLEGWNQYGDKIFFLLPLNIAQWVAYTIKRIFLFDVDVYRKTYNKTVEDMDQPLLIHRPKKKDQQRVCLIF